MRRWYERKAPYSKTSALEPVREALQGELKDVWTVGKRPNKTQRAILARILDVLEKFPPYLDLAVLQAASYERLGNTARAQKILLNWLNLPLLERVSLTPARRDVLGAHLREHWDTFIGVLSENSQNNNVMEFLHQGILEFLTDTKTREKSEKARDMDDADVVAKLRLYYHQGRSPAFADWMLNRWTEGRGRQAFLKRFFATPGSKANAWIFLQRLPGQANYNEELALWVGEREKNRDALFYLLASEPELQGVITRVKPDVFKHLLKDKRHFFNQLIQQEPRNALALEQLVELGDIEVALHALDAAGP